MTPLQFCFVLFFHRTGRQISQVVQRSRHPPRPSENLSVAPRGVCVEGSAFGGRARVFRITVETRN